MQAVHITSNAKEPVFWWVQPEAVKLAEYASVKAHHREDPGFFQCFLH